MRGVYERQIAEQTEIVRQLSTATDKIVGPPNWVVFARICWPNNTAPELARIARKTVRTAERWMSGEFDPPNSVMAALIQKLFERGF